MKMALDLRQTQTVSPQMIASMTVLQYGLQELRTYLSELSYENPMVELLEPVSEFQTDDIADRFRWLSQGDRQNRAYYTEDTATQPIPAAQDDSLGAYLKQQLLEGNYSGTRLRVLTVLIDSLDEHGFFTGNISEAAQLAHCGEEETQAALEELKRLEPLGVGAKDIRESLLLQLAPIDEDTTLARRIVETHLADLERFSLSRLSTVLEQPVSAVQSALLQIAGLNPYPADGFSGPDATIYVQPDLYIYPEGGILRVTGVEDTLPHIQISKQYLNLLETERDPDLQKYLREKLRQAQQAVHDLSNRQSTILRCGEVLARWQASFFEGGSLKKMTLRDVAEELGVHESTVSRTIKDKYIQCDRGLLPMHAFFSRSAGQNPTLCRENIQQALRALISGEDTNHPYSDERLSMLLADQHITVARRTVAKYRMELGILPASARKQANL